MSTAQTLRPSIEAVGRPPTYSADAINAYGEPVTVSLPGETALTVFLEEQEIVTLMTLGTEPARLALGYVFNQRLIENLDAIASINVDWEHEAVYIRTHQNRLLQDWRERMFKRIVTSGCGQGTIFASTLEALDNTVLQARPQTQSEIYKLIYEVGQYNKIYRQAGAVHGCALCQGAEILLHVEDVGRHNAADAIAGHMWLEGISGEDKIFYTTGRLTSEMVMKSAFMGISTLISRSGTTKMGLDMAQKIGMTIIARAKGKHFVVYNGGALIDFDAIPPVRRPAPPSKGQRDL